MDKTLKEFQLLIAKHSNIVGMDFHYSARRGWRFHIKDKEGKDWNFSMLQPFLNWINSV